jgi:hypothetical protein
MTGLLARVVLPLGILAAIAGAPACIWGGSGQDQPRASKSANESSPQGSLTLVNESEKVTNLSAKEFAKLPRKSITVKDHAGISAVYEGVVLAEVLRAAHVSLGKDLKGPLLAHCLLVEAADGYRVVFSLPEVDPSITDNLVLIADRKDGKSLDSKEGPYRLVVPQEKKHARWVRQVTRISVRATADIAAGTKKD